MDYIFTVRRVAAGKFTDKVGSNRFLAVPDGAAPHPEQHKLTPTRWAKEVIAAGRTGKDDATGYPIGDILFYVHGFNTEQHEMLARHRKIRTRLEALGFQGVVVSFDWPSNGEPLSYLADRWDAKETARRLVDEGIRKFADEQQEDCRLNLHVLAHSMGTYVLREAFDDADDCAGIASKSWAVSQVMLVAADVSAKGMQKGSSKSSSLYRHSVRVTNYYNHHDATLKLSNIKRIGVAPRLGRVGLPEDIPGNAVDINCSAYYEANEDSFPPALNRSHVWYFDDDWFFRDIYHTLQGDTDRHSIPTRKVRDGGLTLES